jgi:hypothetical protein
MIKGFVDRLHLPPFVHIRGPVPSVVPARRVRVNGLSPAAMAGPIGLLFLFMAAGSVSAAETGDCASTAEADPPRPGVLSELGVKARVPLVRLREKALKALEGGEREMSGSETVETPFTIGQVSLGRVVTRVEYELRPADIRMSRTGNGKGVLVRTPVHIDADHKIEGPADLALTRSGCGAKTFFLDARFRLDVVKRQVVMSDGLSVDSGDYHCSVGLEGGLEKAVQVVDVVRQGIARFGDKITKRKTVVEPVDTSRDITDDIRSRILAGAGRQLEGFRPMLEAALVDSRAMHALAAKPAVFGNALALGIDPVRFMPSAISVTDGDVEVSGVLRGRPRMHFGDDWPTASPPPEDSEGKPGIRLPLKALFPRADAFGRLADDPPWGQHSFRVIGVQARPGIVAVQHRDGEVVENLLWLTGSTERPGGKMIPFERPMANVLDELQCWLDDPERWQGIDGIAALKDEVAEFQRLLARFEAPTTLDLEERGVLTFQDLKIDLLRAWVTPEAIWAEIVLRGDATLEVTVDI